MVVRESMSDRIVLAIILDYAYRGYPRAPRRYGLRMRRKLIPKIITCLSVSEVIMNGSTIKVDRKECNPRATHQIHNLPRKSFPSQVAS